MLHKLSIVNVAGQVNEVESNRDFRDRRRVDSMRRIRRMTKARNVMRIN